MSAKRLSTISLAILLASGTTAALAGGPDTPACMPALPHGFYFGAGPNYTFGNAMTQWGNSNQVNLGLRGWGGEVFAGYDTVFLNRFYAGANMFFSMNDVRTKGTLIANTTGSAQLDYLWGISVEPGYMPADNVHLYAKIGLADGYFEIKDAAGNENDYSDFGWFIGAGTDVAVSQDLSIRPEYTYYVFGKKTSGNPNAAVRPRFGMFAVSLTYHFS